MLSVALGKSKDYSEITYGLTKPPAGFDSTHGNPTLPSSHFYDHEFVIYDGRQQKTDYLIEIQ